MVTCSVKRLFVFFISLLLQVLSRLTCVETWVCSNVITLIREENTVPFMVRYRKEMINHMDADAVRDVQLVYEELW